MKKYFLICASKDHVKEGVKHGIAQAGHGRKDFVSKMSKGDEFVYYSSKEKSNDTEPCQQFTAIGKITDEQPYQPSTSSGFKPFRRDAEYKNSTPADIRPLIDKLHFIKNKKRWGFYLISGFREMTKEDFDIIKNAIK